MSDPHKDLEFNSKDYEFNSFTQDNNNYHEVFKTNEINNLSTNNPKKKKNNSSSKIINIIRATALTTVTTTVTVVTIINVTFKIDVIIKNLTYSSLSFEIEKSSSMTLSASLLDEEKEIVSSKEFENNLLTFNELSPNSKYILQINHKDDLIYENSFYTLNSPLIKLDEYASDDQNLYFTIENEHDVPLKATLEADNYNETLEITSDTFYFSNLESLKDYNLKIYENESLIFNDIFKTKGPLVIDDIYFERIDEKTYNLCFDNPYSYPVELILTPIQTTRSSNSTYQSISNNGKYQMSDYFNENFKAVFSFNEKIIYETSLVMPYSLVKMEIGSTYFDYIIDPVENLTTAQDFYEVFLDYPLEVILLENEDGNLLLSIPYLDPNTTYKVNFGFYLDNEFDTYFTEVISTKPLPNDVVVNLYSVTSISATFESNYQYKKDITIDVYYKDNDLFVNESYYNEETGFYEIDNLDVETTYIGKVRIGKEKNYLSEIEFTTLPVPDAQETNAFNFDNYRI